MVARMALTVIQTLFLLLLMAPQFKGLNHCLSEDNVTVAFTNSTFRVNESDGFVQLSVELNKAIVCCPISILIECENDSATRNDDYDCGVFPIIFLPNTSTVSFNITIRQDNIPECEENFFVTIIPKYLPCCFTPGSINQAMVTIVDDETILPGVRFSQLEYYAAENMGVMNLTLDLCNQRLEETTVNVQVPVNNVTNDDCEDYCTVIFPAGSKTKNLKINIIDDNTAECNENFSARILPSLHVSRVTPYIATVFVDDDEEKIKVNFSNSTYEANEHEGPAQPVLMLSKPSPCCLHVLVKTMDNTATEKEDEINVTFPVGVACAPFDIPLINDTLSEENETFYIVILEESLPFGVILDADKSTTVTIIDNDFNIQFEKANYTVGEEKGSLEVVLVLDKEATTDVTITVESVYNTATGGMDYDDRPYHVKIKEGETNVSLFVSIFNDDVYENGDGNNGEDFSLTIAPGSLPHGVYPGDIQTTKITILDDEYTFCFELPSYLIEERGVTSLALNLSRPLREDILVNFTYLDLTATGNYTTTNDKIDYYASFVSPYEALIPAGTQEFRLNISIVNDSRLKDYELFRIITGPPNLPKGEMPCSTNVTIRDDDDFVITFDNANYTVEKNEDVVVELLLYYPKEYDGSMFPINVTIDEISVTATGGLTDDAEGIDFVFQNYSYSFDDKEEKKSLIIRTIDDNIVEPDETYILNITTVTAGDSAKLQGRIIYGENATVNITILNDDVTYLRIDDRNRFRLDRPLSEDICLNVTYNNDKHKKKVIPAGKTKKNLRTGFTKVEVLVPVVFRDNIMRSIIVPEDNKIPIVIIFVE